VPNVDEFDVSVSVKCINHGIQRISDDAVTAFHASLFEHFPHQIRYISSH
jgi:hypothetical protein